MKLLYSILIVAVVAIVCLSCGDDIQPAIESKFRVNDHGVILICEDGVWNVWI